MKVLQYPQLLLFLLPNLGKTAQELQCHVEGQCQGITVDFSTTDSYNDCLERCKGNDNCNWITHFGDSSDCVELFDCPFVDDLSCINCFSGQAECQPQEPVCNIPGICNGHLVTANHTLNVESCLEFCQLTAGCNWYSYRLDTKNCLLTEDCLLIDDTCTNCLAGEKTCTLKNPGIIGSKIFVVGGEAAEYEVEIVDLMNFGQTCSRPADYPGLDYGPVGTFIDNSTIVCGGSAGATEKCFNYHPNNDTWTENYSMLQGRHYAIGVMVSPTKWWVTGGGEDDGRILSSTEMFTAGDGFSPYVDLPTATYMHNLVKVNETHYMLLGGWPETNKAWLFNMETETWESLPNLPIAISYTQAGLVTHFDGSSEVVVAAGYNTNAIQIFSLDSQTWRRGPDFPNGILQEAASVPYGNTFLIVGGYVSGAGQQDKIYKYEVNTGYWEELTQKLELARDTLAAFLIPDDFITCYDALIL